MNSGRFSDKAVKISSSSMLAHAPSQNYAALPAQKLKGPINYFTMSILDSEGRKLDLKGSAITVSLRFT